MSIVEKVLAILAVVGFCLCYIYLLAWIISDIFTIFNKKNKEK